jgi:hypothetical protein
MGALSFGVISPPEDLPASEYVTGAAFAQDGVAPVSTLPAARSALIKYQKYETAQQFSSTNPTLTEAARQDLGLDFRSAPTPDSVSVLAGDASAPVALRGGTGETALDSPIDAAAQALLEALWRSVDRRTDSLQLADPVPRFVVGQIINVRMAALDYDNGKNVVVSAVVADDGQGKHSIEVTGKLLAVGGDVLYAKASTVDAILLGDGTGTIVLD